MNATSTTEIAQRAAFDRIRYAQCWEDADVLVDGLNLSPGAVCLSIASAGDNSLSLLSRAPSRVIAVDLNPSQIHCARLKTEAVRLLDNETIRDFHGSGSASPTMAPALYREVLPADLPEDARAFWDDQADSLARGIGSLGKFEQYFEIFRRKVLPLAHSRSRIAALLHGGDRDARIRFYERTWNNWRWRTIFHLFFSRPVLGRLGRDPEFFRYVEGSVAGRILDRARYALTELDPSANPYLHWILRGTHGATIPFWLRNENLDLIRDNIDRIEWRFASLEAVLDELPDDSVDAFNLSDIFEYMSPEASSMLLTRIADKGKPGARIVYWNMLAPRSRPESLAHRIRPMDTEAGELFRRDNAFFYSALRVEEVLG